VSNKKEPPTLRPALDLTGWTQPKKKTDLLVHTGGMMMKLPEEGHSLTSLDHLTQSDGKKVAKFSTPLERILDEDDQRLTLKQVEREIEERAESEGLHIPKNKIRKAVRRSLARMRSKSRLDTWADQVQDECGDVRVLSTATGPIKIVLTCEQGKHEVEWTSANRIPAEAIASKLKREGWMLGRHIRCPEHAHVRKEKKKGEGKVAELVIDNTNQAATDAARTAKRLVMMALEESFVTEKGCYKTGVSDETIAAELKIAPAVVVRLREEFYGPLKVPDEIEDVQRQIEELRRAHVAKVAELNSFFETHFAKLQNRLDALVRKNKWLDA
jgi:hypothetical protein